MMPRKTYAEFTPEQKKRAIERQGNYNKRTHIGFFVQLHATNDADVIEKILQQPSKTDYIRRLIRADIAKTETEE